MSSLTRHPATEPAAAAVPPGVRVYAIGDVHGRLDLLDRMLELIADDGAAAPGPAACIVGLGDYIDRGPQSRGVVERLIAGPPPGFDAILLKGNHEASMLAFLEDTGIAPVWLTYGGRETLASYGVPPPDADSAPADLTLAQERLCQRLPAEHRAFLESLRTSAVIGDYLFVHAGIRPGVPLERQRENDLLWIRAPFLRSTADHGKVVVHGHTISREPELRRNRIGIDTGAFATNRLTCLVLEGTERRFLST